MLRGLFSGRTPSDGLGHPVTAVGDPFQAIYGWRGAAASNILTFAETFRRGDGRPAAELRPDGQPAQRPDHPGRGQRAEPPAARRHRATRTHRRAWVCCGPPTAPRPARSGRRPSSTWTEEVTWIGDQIAGLRAAGAVERWADIAVLTRRNADIAPLYAELTARDVPVEIVGLGGLLHLPEVMDVTATLRLLDDVTANPDLIRLLTGPRWQIGQRDLALLGRRARHLARQAAGPTPDDADADPGLLDGPGAGGGRRRPDRGGQPARRLGEPGRGGLLRRRPGAVRPAGRRARLPAPACRRAGARPGPAGHRHSRAWTSSCWRRRSSTGAPGATSWARSSTRWPPTSTWTARPR